MVSLLQPGATKAMQEMRHNEKKLNERIERGTVKPEMNDNDAENLKEIRHFCLFHLLINPHLYTDLSSVNHMLH